MSFWDALTGRSRPVKPKTTPLFDLSTTWPVFQVDLGWVPAGKAGLVLKPAKSYSFRQAEKDVDSLVELAAKEMNSQIEITDDQYGYRWLLLHDPDWEDLVGLVHMAGDSMDEKGFGEQLLAAAFRLEREEQSDEPLYIIFTYKRGTFYPFLPRAGGHQQRDRGEEMHVYSLMEKELPWEHDISRWYPLWGCPV